jgi:hypothetical protein
MNAESFLCEWSPEPRRRGREIVLENILVHFQLSARSHGILELE